jgi:hypothetical protein
MVVNTKVNGLTIIWKAMAIMYGTMAENMKASIKMTKNMDSVYTLGLTVDVMRVTGGKVNSMALVHILFPKRTR